MGSQISDITRPNLVGFLGVEVLINQVISHLIRVFSSRGYFVSLTLNNRKRQVNHIYQPLRYSVILSLC